MAVCQALRGLASRRFLSSSPCTKDGLPSQNLMCLKRSGEDRTCRAVQGVLGGLATFCCVNRSYGRSATACSACTF